jgi:hypothetical protein
MCVRLSRGLGGDKDTGEVIVAAEQAQCEVIALLYQAEFRLSDLGELVIPYALPLEVSRYSVVRSRVVFNCVAS